MKVGKFILFALTKTIGFAFALSLFLVKLLLMCVLFVFTLGSISLKMMD